MLALARWCSDHRRAVVALWIVVLIAVLGGWRTAGSRYANNFSLGNTGSQHAADVLQKNFPVQFGDRDQIVLYAPGGVRAPAVQARVGAMLARVAGLPHVAQVVSPYAAAAKGQVSRDGKTAFAVVNFDEKANQLSTSATKNVISTAEAADIWFRCYGLRPVSDYLSGDLAATRQADGSIEVWQTLQVKGHPDVFALGDAAAADLKGAGRASRQAEVVVANIHARADGSELQNYEPSPPAIVIPLGPNGGASELPGQEEIAGAEQTAAIKGSHLFIERYRELFGVAQPATP